MNLDTSYKNTVEYYIMFIMENVSGYIQENGLNLLNIYGGIAQLKMMTIILCTTLYYFMICICLQIMHEY